MTNRPGRIDTHHRVVPPDLHVIAHAGHWTQIEQPTRFRAPVRGFLGTGL